MERSGGAVGVGIVGCGAISHQYAQGIASLPGLEIVACADVDLDRAKTWADQYGVSKAGHLDDLLLDEDVEIVVNLTVPKAHHTVAVAAIDAGKSVYNEKPLASDRACGADLLARAEAAGVLVGCAPDTFLGRSLQTCRRLIDEGAIGKPLGASLIFGGAGPEWGHPNPGFFYEPGGGPLFDMGPYYLTALVMLLGPVATATGFGLISRSERTIAVGPDAGKAIPVSVQTHLGGAVQVESGPIATFTMSFDVWGGHTTSMIYGTEGTITLPDPNCFADQVHLFTRDKCEHTPVDLDEGYDGVRGIGVADLALAMRTGSPQMASGGLAFHVLDVMSSILDSAETGQTVSVNRATARPPALDFREMKARLTALGDHR